MLCSCICNAVSFGQAPRIAEKAARLSSPRIELPQLEKHPMIACTPEELGRLKAAYAGRGREQEAVARVIVAAGGQLGRPVVFPPRGGQHNQWYQCDKCQIGLKTVDATHHQCPRCKTVYSGEPYDDVLFARVHNRNLRAMSDAAWAYAITGEEKYAALAAQVLVGYASRYKTYPYHDSGAKTGKQAAKSGGHLFEQTLNEASALAEDIAPAYDLIHGSKSLSAEDHRVIREGLLRPMLENIAKHKTGKSNWQTWHNAAMLWGGAVLGDVAWVRTAIEDPANGFLFQMRASVSEDGMWYENSWGYHFYTLGAMVKIVEGARRLGIDLWRHPVLKRMFIVPVEYAMPDGSLPRFGDDVQTTVSQASRMLEFAYHAYRDPAMLPFLPRQPSWESVMLGRAVTPPPQPGPQASKLFPSAGHAILRTGEKRAWPRHSPSAPTVGSTDISTSSASSCSATAASWASIRAGRRARPIGCRSTPAGTKRLSATTPCSWMASPKNQPPGSWRASPPTGHTRPSWRGATRRTPASATGACCA